MSSRRQNFTLIEVIAVVTIMLLVSTIAVVTLQADPPALSMENHVNQFVLFCNQARVRATEFGQECVVVFNPNENRFLIEANEQHNLPEISWQIPDNLSFSNEFPTSLNDGETIELFRFFPDGAGTGTHNFILKFGTLSKTVSISKLTGQIVVSNE